MEYERIQHGINLQPGWTLPVCSPLPMLRNYWLARSSCSQDSSFALPGRAQLGDGYLGLARACTVSIGGGARIGALEGGGEWLRR